MDNDRTFSVSVLEGSHAGAILALPAGTYRFGRSHDADVVLTDTGLRPMHFSIDLADHGASVASMEGAVTLDGALNSPLSGQGAAAPGNSARLSFPFEVALDGVRLRVDGPEQKNWERSALAAARAWHERTRAWFGRQPRSALAAGLAIACLSLYAAGATSAPEPASATAIAHPPTLPTKAMPIGQAVEKLRARAEKAGLLTQLQIEPAGDAITVHGTLMADQMAAWQDIRREFDAAVGNSFAFDTRIATVTSRERPQLDLQAIWAGTRAYVITASGERLGEGDRLTSGWRIDKIESRRVTLSQGEQRLTLTY